MKFGHLVLLSGAVLDREREREGDGAYSLFMALALSITGLHWLFVHHVAQRDDLSVYTQCKFQVTQRWIPSVAVSAIQESFCII